MRGGGGNVTSREGPDDLDFDSGDAEEILSFNVSGIDRQLSNSIARSGLADGTEQNRRSPFSGDGIRSLYRNTVDPVSDLAFVDLAKRAYFDLSVP
jgi:hypothetical protein